MPARSGAPSTVVRTQSWSRKMKTYEFSVVASGLDPAADDFESRFYEGGCDDALVSFQKGHIILDFAREAETAEEAIASAVADVRAVGAHVDRVEPDPLVNLAEIAARAGLTRAAVSLYAKGRRGHDFPPPVAKVTDESPLWLWASVARWLHSRHQLDEDILAKAEFVQRINDSLGDDAPVPGRGKPARQTS
jgi:predicted DNA-binding transcriptional regulator AlpA